MALSECGIALVLVPHIPSSFLQGLSFIDDASRKIIVGISLRQKRADIFWFTLFHELIHIIEGDIYKVDGACNDDEKKADSLASSCLIDGIAYKNFIDKTPINIDTIQAFADTQEIGVSLVIGRLQKDKIIGYNQFNTYIATYSA